MDKGHKIVLACCATMALMLASCASDELLGEAAGTGRAIAFEVGVAGSIDVTTTRSGADDFLPTSSLELHGGDSTFYANCDERNTIDMHYNTTSASTRGSIQTSSAFYSSFGLYGYVYDSGSTWGSNKASLSPDSKIINLQVLKADGTWKTNVYWPGSTKKATFFAYAPYGDTNASITTTGTPSVTYTVPQTISAQQDLLIAKSTEDILCDGKAQPSLTFNHALTAVTFKQGTLPTGYSIKSIEISGVYNKGELSFEGTEWSNHEGTASYSTTSLSDVLFLMPQTIPSGAKLKVTFTDGSKDDPLEADLGSTVWKKGYKYTYRLSVDKITGTFIFEVTPTSTVSVDKNGGNVEYSVKSYYEWNDGKTKDISWTATFSTDGGSTWSSTAPDWLTGFTASGVGSTTGTNYQANVLAQSSTSVSGVTASSVLQSASKVTDYDLSLHTVSGADCSRTTANCYLVHAAGTYKLPLVYGNAIKNGVTNTTAFSPSGTNGDTFLTPFLNHADAGITDPWLKNNGATPDGAKLIWQDVKGLIASVGISGDYLTFTVSSTNIAEGNAVIAATKSGTVVWSWHIWMTPETLSTQTSIAGNSYTYKVTPVNLGWVNSGTISWTGYEARSCTVKITQFGGQEKTFIVSQSPSKTVTASKQGVNTYYQWGRKDPDIPAEAYNSSSNHKAYNISGVSVPPTLSPTSVAIGTTIQNPLIHYCNKSYKGPYSTNQYNLWDANNTITGQIKTKTVKTIYDPCPPGFCIPTSDLWYKMSGNNGTGNYKDGSWDKTNLGRLWTSNSPNVFFPASGYREHINGSISYVGSYSYYWSASPNSGDSGPTLYLKSGNWNWWVCFRSYGFPVRAVLEE